MSFSRACHSIMPHTGFAAFVVKFYTLSMVYHVRGELKHIGLIKKSNKQKKHQKYYQQYVYHMLTRHIIIQILLT